MGGVCECCPGHPLPGIRIARKPNEETCEHISINGVGQSHAMCHPGCNEDKFHPRILPGYWNSYALPQRVLFPLSLELEKLWQILLVEDRDFI